jgi:uncharacterized protein (DUF169 family)
MFIMTCPSLAEALVCDLGLTRTPVGIAFLKSPPAGIARHGDAVPSACAFWKAAETRMFYATAEDHYNCPIGAITQGFPIPQPVGDRAMSLIQQMGKLAYFEAAEAEHVPKVGKDHAIVVYGPLREFSSFEPDLALLVCTPFQAMLISEIAGAVSWSGDAAGRVHGRPACAVIPSALASGLTSLSVGCMGARTFAEIREGELLVAVPGTSLPQLAERLPVILGANASMKDYYVEQSARFEP